MSRKSHIYVKNWEVYNNKKLPKGYEIHHIDGNHDNNDPKNLKAVTIHEHFMIHYEQKDYGATQAILARMSLTDEQKEIIKECASKHQLKLLAEGKHNFQKMTKEKRREISKKVGNLTLEQKKGIHLINSDATLAKENAKKARAKLSREQELNMMRNWQKKIKGSIWWNDGNINKRAKEKPGPNFVKGILKR